jgi:deoxyribose-phosphate aldolase
MEETKEAIENGAKELDVVLHIGRLKSGKYDYVRDELKLITDYAHHRGVKIKVIFENCYLTDEEKVMACEICNEVGTDWIKTSTGYGTGGAENADLLLMRKHARPDIQLKAAGGIRTLERAIEVKELGCTRIGATATADILAKIPGR